MSDISPIESGPIAPPTTPPPTGGTDTTTPITDTIGGPSEDISSLNATLESNGLLPVPQPLSISVYFNALNDALMAFRNQLDASSLQTAEIRRKLVLAVGGDASALSFIREAVIALYNQNKAVIEPINTEITEQNQRINTINEGFDDDEQETEDLNDAIETYNAAVEAYNAAIAGGATGPQLVAAIAAYNAAATAYNSAVVSYNAHVIVRNGHIASYNANTAVYNGNVNSNNAAIEDENELISEFPGISPLGFQGEAQGSLDTLPVASQVNLIPSGGPVPSSISTVDEFDMPDTTEIEEVELIDFPASENIYLTQALEGFNKIMDYKTGLLDLVTLIESSTEKEEETILQQLLPSAFIEQKAQGSPVTSTSGSSISLGAQVATTSTISVEGLFSAQLIEQVFKDFNTNLSPEIQTNINILASSLLGSFIYQSILPGLSALTPQLPKLSAEDPAVQVTLALSLSNRIQEAIKFGILSDAIDAFLQASPIFKSAEESEERAAFVRELTEAFANSFLAIGGTILSKSLGIPTLSSNLIANSATLAPAFEELLRTPLPDPDRESQAAEILDNLLKQGFEPNSAEFLQKTAIDLLDQGFLRPPVGIVSQNTVNLELLESTLASSLILRGVDLDESQRAAREILEETFADNQEFSEDQFRLSLDNILRERGFRGVADQVVVAINNLDEANLRDLSNDELLNLAQERAFNILRPSLGNELATNVSESIRSSLGNPDLSFISLANERFDSNVQEISNEELVAKVEDFRRFIQPSINVNMNLLRIMDPGELFLTSAFASISYAGAGNQPKNMKQSIDIIV